MAEREPIEFEPPKRVTGHTILRAVAKFYKVPVVDIESERRTANVTLPRQVVMFLCREMTTLSLPAIGRILGKRDHTTALHGYEKIKRLLPDDPELRADVLAIKRSLLPPEPEPPAVTPIDPNQMPLPFGGEGGG